jgi:hypothetical protein
MPIFAATRSARQELAAEAHRNGAKAHVCRAQDGVFVWGTCVREGGGDGGRAGGEAGVKAGVEAGDEASGKKLD